LFSKINRKNISQSQVSNRNSQIIEKPIIVIILFILFSLAFINNV
jgi:hypothetical protein